MENYKEEIVNSRKGCLGGSDAKMLNGIAVLGAVPKSAEKRLAVCKGLIEHQQFTNSAMRYGDFIENIVYEMLREQDERWQSNPCLVSDKYSRKNVKCIDHVDYMLVDDEAKVLTIGECKATRLTYAQARNEYKDQLNHHHLLGMELAKKLGNYRLRVLFCHYNTDGVDVDIDFEFQPDRLTVKPIKFAKVAYDLDKAMDIVDEYLEGLTEYYEEDEVLYELLPVAVQKEFDGVTTLLNEIKAREEAVDAFKAKLYDFMVAKNIKSIKNDAWSITRVDATVSKQFDSKKYLDEFAAKHPRKYKEIIHQYEKTVNRKGYVNIKLKNKK
jgi:hypothetical protein